MAEGEDIKQVLEEGKRGRRRNLAGFYGRLLAGPAARRWQVLHDRVGKKARVMLAGR